MILVRFCKRIRVKRRMIDDGQTGASFLSFVFSVYVEGCP